MQYFITLNPIWQGLKLLCQVVILTIILLDLSMLLCKKCLMKYVSEYLLT